MFTDPNSSYHCSTPPSDDSPFECYSFSSSFSPSASDSSAASWDPATLTPTSTPRASPDSDSLEDGYRSSCASFCTPGTFENGAYFGPDSIMTEELLSGFQYPVIPTQAAMGYTEFSTATNDGLPQTPSLALLCTPHSSVSADFVVPSQTTFTDTFDVGTPHRPANLKVEFEYDSPNSEYSINSSPLGSMPYHMPLSYNGCRSASSTPSRSSVRQPKFEPLSSSAALHLVQGIQTLPSSGSTAARSTRRRVKREVQDCILPGTIRVQKEATQECRWEGCKGKKFQRKEHLRRHERSVHLGFTIECVLCHHLFNRTDNLKQHYKLHAQVKRKGTRTGYYADAQRLVDEMERKSRKTGEQC
ncbi:uncharacterized protein BP5553_07409 [Venustampulla echinocandica]|uniref:C2H2-type domain-containing protein n=1 Tax=Venustampulla echinocandica TaxID=2656787 RepID=A0A370TJF2_9HELO|nr:uncharacterized protein BP5553_07409 [Venustampulla echinocandica]RDL35478.1 hypothetical protein BP5553_07409 [Venustampulla echinocandica]